MFFCSILLRFSVSVHCFYAFYVSIHCSCTFFVSVHCPCAFLLLSSVPMVFSLLFLNHLMGFVQPTLSFNLHLRDRCAVYLPSANYLLFSEPWSWSFVFFIWYFRVLCPALCFLLVFAGPLARPSLILQIICYLRNLCPAPLFLFLVFARRLSRLIC